MKFRNSLNGYEFEGALTVEHAASSYGQPVLIDVDTREAIDKMSFALAEILEASAGELEELAAAGYHAEATQ